MSHLKTKDLGSGLMIKQARRGQVDVTLTFQGKDPVSLLLIRAKVVLEAPKITRCETTDSAAPNLISDQS